MSKCKLCKEEKKLVKESHIIPGFMYNHSGLFDEDHKIVKVTVPSDSEKPFYGKKISQGEYEAGLLCEECENRVIGSTLEGYAKRIIFGGQVRDSEKPIFTKKQFSGNKTVTLCENIDYHKFKLFLLSILWRGSIAKREYFKEIALGYHEKKIRKMIIDNNPMEVSNYPIIIYFFTDNLSSKIISQPKRRRTKSGYNVYFLHIGRLLLMYYINSSDHLFPSRILEYTIKPSGDLSIVHIPKTLGIKTIMNEFGLLK